MATPMPRSPLAPAAFPDLPVIGGLRFATAASGIKYQGRTDVMLAVMDPGTSIAGVFTRSATRSAPVLDCQAKLGSSTDQGAALLVNSGNSNAFTGHYGQTSVAEITAAVAAQTGVPQDRVFTASTGVIGEPLPHDRIVAKLAELNGALSDASIEAAAKAIMTTDTFAKGASATVEIDGKPVRIAGIAKGSGMIAPDMATMLVYIFTDAAYDQAALQGLLSAETDTSFNCITVDSDTSTSDSLMLCATGASGVDATGNPAFTEALRAVMLDLAHQVVRDGEGATKFVEIQVTGAETADDAKVHGMSIANSPLVKTAIAGEDPNWGRIVMAIGKSGAKADRDLLSISFGDVLVAEKGWVAPSYKEELGAAEMKKQEITIKVDLGLGDGQATVWTCDLTHQYISINADYRS
ncbi:bifunctional glutamate N-acetyltransferase/amino-acid acetyltransferase ArgJ [Phaeobacter sp. HF9A]|uniref:bifunctional glutamate N-acetyltransferase/amino-acid acetyltransferase ArgJ n=1 Tax=Phaeobacter sp. HF9A TaxID=2721561 RepID=UPI00142F98B5|nr:bifunctional glutamate N-acetyltransferase/amino-acid acetyltransferase ArgJ [Phaeobacter sp. HF9A]NIZ11861.1 bifunctional glutamate N-acetyltransferase/amino-acid acetyltransferase ArgJ [Phaeobacter sp. HF9A]